MSLINELKSEIARLARREIKKELEPIKRVNASQRKYIADLRRDITELQKEIARLQKQAGKAAPAAAEPTSRSWITGKGVAALRKKLRLTQAGLAELAGVSTQSVVNWEKQTGKIAFRQQATAARMQLIKGMTKKEAWAELG